MTRRKRVSSLMVVLTALGRHYISSEVEMRIGLREANQQFSKAVKAVKAGEEVVLTERGKPIGVIRPLGSRELVRRRSDGWKRQDYYAGLPSAVPFLLARHGR